MIGSVEYLLITIIIYIFSENLLTIANLLLQLFTLLWTKTTLSKKKFFFWSKRYTYTEYILLAKAYKCDYMLFSNIFGTVEIELKWIIGR